ncbi:MAG: hypothetical protein IBX57_00885 [Gammaproteobacteria bacterium]|nr:hypothetical protein [Gammaproteobacteria bacterium]
MIYFKSDASEVYAYESEEDYKKYGRHELKRISEIEAGLLANPPLTESEVNSIERKEKMTTGLIYTLRDEDYSISFTSKDALGILQVTAAFNTGLEKTTIHFENGTKLPITNIEFKDFSKWFNLERSKFF